MIGPLMMCVSVVVLVFGMVLGIVTGIREDFALQPAHAHLNLVGGVMLFLFGLYYRLVPAAGKSALAKVQGWLHIIGGLLLPAGVAVVITDHGAFCGDCVPHGTGLNGLRHILRPIRGIVRGTDSPAPVGPQPHEE